MEKYTKTIVLIVFLLTNAFLQAQEFQGEATYKTSRKIDFKMNSDAEAQGMDQEMQQKINDMMQKQFQKEYKLTFNSSESIYKQEEQLAAPQPSAGNMEIIVMGNGQSQILYKNTKEKQYINQEEILGKMFLIKDSLRTQDWKLENEQKFIGQYQCYKATRTVEVKKMQSINVNDAAEISEPEKETITITAWYAPEIPVNTGPGDYWGLPGLILEVNDGSQTIVCSKIVLNPKKKVAIEAPTKGKKVNREKFNEILMKKSKEMAERYSGNGKESGNTFEIKIGQ